MGKSDRRPRILHLPVNVASLMSHNIGAQREQGIDARGVAFQAGSSQSQEGIRFYDVAGLRRWTWRWLFVRTSMVLNTLRLIVWADVVHWYSGIPFLPMNLDLSLIRLLKKPAVNVWTGSEIRIPELESQTNPYYRLVFPRGYEYADESYSRSCAMQARIAAAGMIPIASPGMIQYVLPKYASGLRVVPNGISLEDSVAAYPLLNQVRPLIVHAPTAPVGKGTYFVEKALERLRKFVEFEYVLIQDMPRAEALSLMRTADIYLDQFILGDYGMAAVEAMVLGKPVVCFIKDAVREHYPNNLPIVSANPDNLSSVLFPLIKDAHRRAELGHMSRMYAEGFHDICLTTKELIEVYQDAQRARRPRRP